MKSSTDIRLECLRLANGMCIAKAIRADEVIQYAMSFYEWVDGTNRDPDIYKLAEKFKVVGKG